MDDVRHLVRRAARNLYRVVEDPEFWTIDFCRAFFEWCGTQAIEKPTTVLLRGQVALEVAAKTGDSHTLAKAHGVMALAYRRMQVLELAEAELKTALTLAGSCPCCLADILRCKGIIKLFQHHYHDAIACFDSASAHHRSLGNQDGIGRCLIARGIALWRLGKVDDALDDERRALRLLSPDTPEFFYTAALTNTAAFLATGEERHFVEAEPFLNKVRDQLAGLGDMTAVRICLSWIHGLVLARLGERKRALQMLRKVRARLLRRRQDADVVAVTADISRLYCDTRRFRYIKKLMYDCLEELRHGSGTRPLLEKVLDGAERELDETRQRLAELREAVSVSVPALYKAPSLTSVAAP